RDLVLELRGLAAAHAELGPGAALAHLEGAARHDEAVGSLDVGIAAARELPIARAAVEAHDEGEARVEVDATEHDREHTEAVHPMLTHLDAAREELLGRIEEIGRAGGRPGSNPEENEQREGPRPSREIGPLLRAHVRLQRSSILERTTHRNDSSSWNVSNFV